MPSEHRSPLGCASLGPHGTAASPPWAGLSRHQLWGLLALPPGACSGPYHDPSTCPLWAGFTPIPDAAFVGKVVCGPGLEGLRSHTAIAPRGTGQAGPAEVRGRTEGGAKFILVQPLLSDGHFDRRLTQSLPRIHEAGTTIPLLLCEKAELSHGELCAWLQSQPVVEKGPNPSDVWEVLVP